MRLSEKTLELNFASQMNHHFGGKLLWFGLTQKQEAKAGFDIATKIGTGLFIVQMKASNLLLKSTARQFITPHDQLQKLLNIKLTAAGLAIPGRSVFYAFPTIGSTAELSAHPDIFANSWLCDVMKLSALGPPTSKKSTKAGGVSTLRKNGCHYVDVIPGKAPIAGVGTATFHSEPVTVATAAGKTAFTDIDDAESIAILKDRAGLLEILTENNFEDFWKLSQFFKRRAFGIILKT